MLDNFSFSVQRMLAMAESIAKECCHPSVGSEHLLLSLLKNEDLIFTKELNLYNLKYRTFSDKIKHLYSKEKKIKQISYSFDLKELLEEAIKIGTKNKESLISCESLIIAMLKSECVALELLEKEGVNIESLIKKITSSYKKKSELLSLNDLHLLGSTNKDPLIGRDNEIIQLVYALSRRNKPNAILIGEPGVGKTALVEELGKRLLNNEIPLLKNKVIYELDIASTVSGTKYRGEFEDKLKKIIKKVKEDGNAILFIDEIHNIIKAGGAEGAIDASNILKPYLARGDIQVIGATTLEEFNDSFDKDKALKRRFQIINVNEPTAQETLNILNKIYPIYEDYYNISISSELLSDIIYYSDKFIINQRFPDKAIELLDNSCVIAENVLTKDNILDTLNKLYSVNINDKKKTDEFEKEFNKNVVGQTKVKKDLLRIFSQNKANSLLFYGQKGSGKHLISSLVSKVFFNNSYLHIDIKNYLDATGVNRILNNGLSMFGESISPLIKILKEKPNSVILFEGMEEINNDLISLFQNALENGYIIDSKGGKISIKNALFIFSMNEIKENYAFKFNSRPNKNSFDQIEEKIGYKLFSLIDDVLIFDRIDMSDYKNIVINELKKNNFTFETSKIPDIDESILSSNGGDAALKKAKEILKNKKILKIK